LADTIDNGDGSVTEIWRDSQPFASSNSRFPRLEVSLVKRERVSIDSSSGKERAAKAASTIFSFDAAFASIGFCD